MRLLAQVKGLMTVLTSPGAPWRTAIITLSNFTLKPTSHHCLESPWWNWCYIFTMKLVENSSSYALMFSLPGLLHHWGKHGLTSLLAHELQDSQLHSLPPIICRDVTESIFRLILDTLTIPLFLSWQAAFNDRKQGCMLFVWSPFLKAKLNFPSLIGTHWGYVKTQEEMKSPVRTWLGSIALA